jgi:hypothetical protein
MLDMLTSPETIEAVVGTVLVALGFALRLVIKRIEREIEAKTGFEIADRQTARIHSAIMTGLLKEISKRGPEFNLADIAERERAIREAIGWAKADGAGDSVAARGLTDRQLQVLAESKIGQAVALVRGVIK